MFNNNVKKGTQPLVDNIPTPGKADTTIIGTGSKFNGTLITVGIVRVDGYFSGEITVEGSVIVGENGYIKGNIKSSKVTIAGNVEGNIYCSGCLELTASGKLHGDIEVKNVSIEDGAVFTGKCSMIQQTSSPGYGSEANSGDTNTISE